jgi:hypothetical protein
MRVGASPGCWNCVGPGCRVGTTLDDTAQEWAGAERAGRTERWQGMDFTRRVTPFHTCGVCTRQGGGVGDTDWAEPAGPMPSLSQGAEIPSDPTAIRAPTHSRLIQRVECLLRAAEIRCLAHRLPHRLPRSEAQAWPSSHPAYRWCSQASSCQIPLLARRSIHLTLARSRCRKLPDRDGKTARSRC